MRYINTDMIIAAQLTTPDDNPLVDDDTRLINVWFDGSSVKPGGRSLLLIFPTDLTPKPCGM
jgi:hypothetical protein